MNTTIHCKIGKSFGLLMIPLAFFAISSCDSSEKYTGEWSQRKGPNAKVHMTITKDGKQYKIDIRGRGTAMGTKSEDGIDTGTIAGSIRFSDDGSTAYFDGIEYYRVEQ